MNGDFTYALAFATGIFGAFHCLGMCSGINGGFFVHYGRFPRLLPQISFHAMRIAVYTLLGVSGALLGQVVVQTGLVGKMQGILMIIAGLLIVILGLNLLGLFDKAKKQRADSIKVAFSHQTSAGMADFSKLHITPLVAGLLNGLVPCSLVFSVAIKAAATADPIRASLLMLSFGAGTLPAMGAVSLLGSLIGTTVRRGMVKLAGIGVMVLGLWTVYEGVVFYDIMRGLANW